MNKLISRTLLILSIFLLLFIFYFSTIGFETNKLNNQISNKFKEIHKEVEIELNDVNLILNPFKFNIKAKT